MKQNTIERVNAVLEHSGMSMNKLALHIGLKRGDNLYQIKKGNNGISVDVADRICAEFPDIDKLWLLTGDGDMLHIDSPTGPWSDISTPNSEAFRGWVAGLVLPELLTRLNCPDPCVSAVEYAEKLQAELAKKGGKQ